MTAWVEDLRRREDWRVGGAMEVVMYLGAGVRVKARGSFGSVKLIGGRSASL